MASLQRNVASQVVFFGLVNASTGAAFTGAVFTAKAWVTVDAGAQGGFAGAFTELGNGQYKYVPTQGETNGAAVGLQIAPTTAIPVHLHFYTEKVDANGLVQVDVEDWKGAAVVNAAAGIPKVDVDTIKTNPVVNAGTITFPTTATLASTTNITAGTITTVSGNVTGSVGSVVGNIGGGVAGAVNSVINPVTVGTNNDKTGYSLTAGEETAIADAILDRNLATGSDSGSPTVRTVRQALRFLRNKWSISGSTLTVTKEDDTTASWTSALTTTAGADPITGFDPAG